MRQKPHHDAPHRDSETCLARKLTAFGSVSSDEQAILRELSSGVRVVRRRGDIVTEGKKYRTLLLVLEGILMRYRILRDGRRQIVSLAVPGDFAGAPGCFFDGALYSIKAVTDAVVAPVPFDRLFGTFESQPRLAAKLFWSFSCEAAIYAENLVGIGRLSALERVGHFLLELLTRLRAIGLADECSCAIPLSQEMIADALGLSLPYVNRVLRQLDEGGLVTLKGQRLVIKDVEALSALAEFEPRYLQPQPIGEYFENGWAPVTSAAA